MLKISCHSSLKLVIRAGIHKMLVRIAKREDPDQTASSLATISLLSSTNNLFLIG